jgi:hypothetical protein
MTLSKEESKAHEGLVGDELRQGLDGPDGPEEELGAAQGALVGRPVLDGRTLEL